MPRDKQRGDIDIKGRDPDRAKAIQKGFSPDGRREHRKKRMNEMLESIRAELPFSRKEKKKQDED